MVVALLDGRRTRGFVYDVSTERGDFHLYASDDPGETKAELIKIADCKGIYFVKSLTGNPNYRENKTDLPERRRWGRAIDVVFHDGEHIVGTTEIYYPGRVGFYLVPPDPRSNNLRIYVVAANVRSVKVLDQSTGEGTEGVWEAPDPATFPSHKRNEVVMRLLKGQDVDKLSTEVFLPVPILEFWKARFMGGALAALTDEALSRPVPGDEGGRPGYSRDRTPPGKRLDLILRLLGKEDGAVVSQVFLVPLHALADWRDRAMDAGKAALRALSEEESGHAPEVIQARYEALLIALAPRSATDDFLDSLTASLALPSAKPK